MTNPLDISQKHYILNGELKEVSSFNSNLIACQKTIYEVVKVVDGAPLFLCEHLNRLLRSCNLAGYVCPNFEYVTLGVEKLLTADRVDLKNIRISLCYETSQNPSFLCYYVVSHYPDPLDYKHGVRIEVLQHKRVFPNIKSDNPTLRKAADDVIKSKNVFETLLVDDDGYVTECSRSNFFAVCGNKLITPPAADVLEGITRMKVLELARINGFDHIEQRIKLDKLPELDGAFITGTSPGVLPVNLIGEFSYRVNNYLISRIIALYNDLAEENIKNWKLLKRKGSW